MQAMSSGNIVAIFSCELTKSRRLGCCHEIMYCDPQNHVFRRRDFFRTVHETNDLSSDL